MRQPSIIAAVALLLTSESMVSAFAPSGFTFGVTKYNTSPVSKLEFSATTEETTSAPKLFDSKNNEFVEGAIVRVSASVNAFHLLAKWSGTYDEGE